VKGLTVLAVLFATIGGALWLLVKPSDRDLEVIEERIAASLDVADSHLTDATRILNGLRAIKPNILLLDRDLDDARIASKQLRAILAEHEADRPESRDGRGPRIDARKESESRAEALGERVVNLVARAELVAEFMGATQPRVQVMRAKFGELFRLRDKLANDGTLDDTIRVKVDYLQLEVNKKQTLAKSVFDTGSRDADQGRILLNTAAKEVEQIIKEIDALRQKMIQ